MKSPDRHSVSQLEALPNIGNAIAQNLKLIGVEHPQQLIGKNAYELHEALGVVLGKRQDPCVIDVFLSVITFMEGGEALPWWSFTNERKKYLAQQVDKVC